MTHIFLSRHFFLKSGLLLLLCMLPIMISAQISYGGHPMPFHADARATAPSSDFFVEMPSFNIQEAVLRSEQDKARFKSLEFAHKFHVHLRPDNSGITFTNYNMNVWRLGIRSKSAHSLNILFSKFRLPEGANVFVYNADQTEILGSYTHQNNTELNLLPVQPIAGEELIVEYQEPVNASFKGEIEIGEVNHDFRGLFRATEPRDPKQSCHPNLICYPEDIEPGSGVVALIINGTTYCTGSLVNNTAEDGTPYLLTATHCLNGDYNPGFIANRKYDIVAGRIVAFFNYNSPVCNKDIRGPVQMTMASADSVLISERYDISLLKLKQTPPQEYQPYYLGWSATSSPSGPFHGLHHPNGGIKKVAIDNDALAIGSFDNPKYNMEPNAHWAVRGWETGATEGGSSGSPLLDKDKRILGTLTGGESMCSSPRGPDVYGSLHKFWNVENSINNPNPIKHYLDPQHSDFIQLGGFNPYANAPIAKNHNFKTDETPAQTYHNSVPMFATNNTFGYTEFAEEFNAAPNTKIQGVFLSSPPVNNISAMSVWLRIYAGEKGPERLLHEQPFTYNFRFYSNNGFSTAPRDMKHNVENYIKLNEPLPVSGRFYISYADANGVSSGFSTLNVEPRNAGSGISSTAWMKNSDGWVRSSENIENPINTSLFIAPYVIGDASLPTDPQETETEVTIYHSKEAQRIFIESNKELLQWEIVYSSGQKIYQGSTGSSINRASYPSGHLARGVYIVKVKTMDGKVTVRKVLVM